MSAHQAWWKRHPFVCGLLLGWLVGMAWWTGLLVAAVIHSGGVETGMSDLRDLELIVYAPLAAIPWAVVGLVSGGFTLVVPGWWVPFATVVGGLAGGTYCAMGSPFDGWLALTMPVYCLGWALAGVPVGVLIGAFWEGIQELRNKKRH